ncbi:MAG TPA: hypothetical protein VEI02_09300, partial [Planctomycetota bacterium]|nr:hypothetical protein [Planctomycetota bacterium]
MAPPKAAFSSPSDVLDVLARTKTFRRFVDLVEGAPGETASHVGGCVGSLLALLLAAAAREKLARPILLLVPLDQDGRAVAQDLAACGAPAPLLLRAGEEEALDRVRALVAAAGTTPWLTIACAATALDPLPSRSELGERRLRLAVGARADESDLVRAFADAGFERTAVVAAAGQFAVRGDLVDVYDHSAGLPLRIELFDGRVEGLRRFDPASQISVRTTKE